MAAAAGRPDRSGVGSPAHLSPVPRKGRPVRARRGFGGDVRTCDQSRRWRRSALERLDFLRFQQEYRHERNRQRPTTKVRELSNAAAAAFDDKTATWTTIA